MVIQDYRDIRVVGVIGNQVLKNYDMQSDIEAVSNKVLTNSSDFVDNNNNFKS